MPDSKTGGKFVWHQKSLMSLLHIVAVSLDPPPSYDMFNLQKNALNCIDCFFGL